MKAEDYVQRSIPLCDVKGFIENGGDGYVLSGYWKAYSNEQEIRDLFTKFDDAKDEMIRMLSKGYSIKDITKAYQASFVSDLEGFVSGKTIGLFGSYGWGDGQWMRDWVDRLTAAGATIVGGEGVICQDAPDGAAEAACQELGKALAAV